MSNKIVSRLIGERPNSATVIFNQLHRIQNCNCNSEGNFGHPGPHKPRNGLLRTLCDFQKVLRRPVRGFSVYRVHRNALLVGRPRTP